MAAQEMAGAPITRLSRGLFFSVWHRKRYEVMVLKDGFEMDGKMYSSLSSIATKICGVNRNGFEFFGIQKG